MYGSILGDIIGSVYEMANTDNYDFELFSPNSSFTDDTVLTIASAEALMAEAQCSLSQKYAYFYKQYYKRYPNAGFGYMFSQWAVSDEMYKNKSYGNGAAMRAAPFGYAFDDINKLTAHVKASCAYTHNNREAKNGALSVAYAIFASCGGASKQQIKDRIEKKYGFNLNFSLAQVRKSYVFDSRTRCSVPHAIKAFLESHDYESTIRNAVYLGGDSDTIAAIAGGIAESYYREIPKEIWETGEKYLNKSFKDTIKNFYEKYNICTRIV